MPANPSILEHWLQNYSNALLKTAFFYLKDTYLAEDALQDTLLKAYQNYDAFAGKSSEKTWLTRILINTCKSYLRRNSHLATNDFTIIDSFAAPETKTEDEDLLKTIWQLPIKYKEVILLYYYHEYKTKEITQILQIPISTVSVRLMRAKETLRQQWKGDFYDE